MKLTSWNVNGIRASLGKGRREYMLNGDADVICLQETKVQQEQVDQPPSLLDTRPRSDRSRCSGRDSKFLVDFD